MKWSKPYLTPSGAVLFYLLNEEDICVQDIFIGFWKRHNLWKLFVPQRVWLDVPRCRAQWLLKHPEEFYMEEIL